MLLNQVKSIALSLLLVAGTVATGVVVAATQLSGRPGDAGQTSQAASAPADRVDGDDLRAETEAAQPDSKVAPKSVSAGIVQQVRAAGHSFDNLLSNLHDPSVEDIDRLSRWSNLTLQADLVLAAGEPDRRAAYEAHRDRMKKLYERIQKLPVSAKNQPVEAVQARRQLEEAEQLLEAGKSSMMSGMGMMSQMGSQMGMMRGRTGQGAFAGSMARMGGSTLENTGSAPGADRKQDPSQTKSRSSANATGGGGSADGAMGGMARRMAGAMGGEMGNRARQAISASALRLAIRDKNPKSKAILNKLDEPLSMSFNEETPLDDVVKYIKQATTTKTHAGMPIYVDPKGLKEAEATMTSTIRGIDLEGVPLRTSLRLLLKQLGLAYCVRDGVLIISSEQGIFEELLEAQRETENTVDMEGGAGGDGSEKPARGSE